MLPVDDEGMPVPPAPAADGHRAAREMRVAGRQSVMLVLQLLGIVASRAAAVCASAGEMFTTCGQLAEGTYGRTAIATSATAMTVRTAFV